VDLIGYFTELAVGEKDGDSETLLDIFSLPGETKKPKGLNKEENSIADQKGKVSNKRNCGSDASWRDLGVDGVPLERARWIGHMGSNVPAHRRRASDVRLSTAA
jgi:hypothetical protein